MSEKPVLLISGGPITQALWPLLAEKYRLAFLFSQAAQLAAEGGISDPIAVMNGADMDLREDAANSATVMAAGAVVNMKAVSRRFTLAFGPGAPEYMNGKLGSWWPGYVNYQLHEQITFLATLEKLWKSLPVVGFVTHEDVTPTMRAAVLFTQARGVPAIHVPHAACHLRPDSGVDVHRETRAGHVLASGEYMRSFYAAAGVPDDHITIVGAPQYDGMYHGNIPEHDEARRVLGIATERAIVYAGTWAQTTSTRGGFEREFDEGLAAVFRLANKWRASVLISLHPSGNPAEEKYYVEALKQAGLPGLVTRFHSTYLLRAADLVVAQSPSNFCIFSAIMGTPSVYLQTEGFDYAHALPFRCLPDGLDAAAEEAMASRGDPAWQSFIKHYNDAHPEGNAAERAVQEIEALCSR